LLFTFRSDPVLGVEMASTGEVACFGKDKEEAFLKSLLSTGFKMPKKNILLSVQDDFADDITHSAYQLHELGYNLYGTKATADMLNQNGVPCKEVDYPTEATGGIDPLAMIREDNIGLVINVPSYKSKRLEDNYLMRRTSVDFGVPLMTNLQLVKCFADAAHKLKKGEMLDLDAKTLFEHYKEETEEDAWTGAREFH
jgi:carbamoyl-phosphate synthase (ammonia)